MRIVAGRFKGHGLHGPKGSAIRPTSDRLRESLFNILVHGYGEVLAHTRVLDLFAGTGALGLEALSRGARFALFVDEGAEARAILRTNIETLGLTGATKLFRRDATKLGPAGPIEPFDLVFCDPPYGRGLGEQALAAAHAGGWLAEKALIIVEEARESAFARPEGLSLIEARPFGDSQLLFLTPQPGSNKA